MSIKIRRTLTSAVRFTSLNAADQSVFLTALIGMAVVRVALLFVPVHRLIGLANRLGSHWPILEPEGVTLPRVAKRIAQARRFVPFSTCLSEAIAAHLVMSRLGHESEVRIGVAKSRGTFAAHAWLECPGSIVIGNAEPEGKQYVRMPSLRRFIA